MALAGRILTTVEELEPYIPEWDALAVSRRLVFCAPGWVLPWWHHVAPADAQLRVVLVLDGERLIAIAPFYARAEVGGVAGYRMVGGAVTHRIEPLAPVDAIEETAAVIAGTLAAARPVPARLRFDGIPDDSRWPRLLGRAWPGRGRPFIHREPGIPAPTVSLEHESFDAWMAAKSSNFRQQMRRARRKLEGRGAVFRTAATPDEIAAGLPDFERLHHARWEPRGGSRTLTPAVVEMLRDAGRNLVDDGRYRLESIELDGQVISSHLFISAGDETSYWLGGFDDRYAAQRPSMLSLVGAVQEGFDRGDRRLDLGQGAQPYKYRLADGEDCLNWLTLVPPGPHYGRAMVLLAPRRLRFAITTRLPPETKAQLRRLLGLNPRGW